MSALIESTERAPGLPKPLPPYSEAAKAFADACLSAWRDEETMTVRAVRRLMLDAYDQAVSDTKHEADMAAQRGAAT